MGDMHGPRHLLVLRAVGPARFPGASEERSLNLRLRAALLAATLVATGCTPVLCTGRSFGVGCFWEIEASKPGPVYSERFKGVGLTFSSEGVAVGWSDVERLQIDIATMPSGRALVGSTTICWGVEAERLARHLSLTARTEQK